MATTTTPTLDVRADFPIIVARDRRAPARLPRLRRHLAEAGDGDRRDGRLLPPQQREHPPRRLPRSPRRPPTLFEGARERVAAFTGGDATTTIFTRNATEAINLVAYAWGREHVGAGDVVLITQMEHHSNIVPWQLLCQETGAELRYLDVADDGTLSLDQLDEELAGGRVKLAAFAHISNVLGTINPVAEMAARVRAAGATSLVDGSQGVPQLPVDVGAIDADFYVWTGHKALGPTGIGVLHGRREMLEAMRPFLGGGDMIRTRGLPGVDLERPAVEVRGRHLDDRRGRGPRGGRRLPGPPRHGARARARARSSPPTRSSASPRSRACA